MALLQEGVKIYQRLGGDYVIGITSSSNESEIIITKHRSVETFKVGDTKPLSSWSTKLPLPFSCPVIFNQTSNEFVGICNKTSLVKWTYETQDLNKKHFKQVGSNIRAVLTSKELEEPVVVFFNGYVENLGSVSEGRKKTRLRKLSENEEIMKQWLAKGGQAMNVIILTERNKEYQLLIVSVPCRDGGTAFHFPLQRPTEESTICDSCFFQDGDLSWLFILWSNGSVWRYPLDVVMRMEDRLSQLDGQRILKLSSDSNMSMVRISAIHADYIAVSGLRGLDDETSESLSIWCIPFGTLQCHVRLPTSQKQTEGDGENKRLVWLKDHLFCATSASLTCHSCHCESGTLAQALGKLSVAPKDEEEEGNVVIKWSTDEVVIQKSSLDILKTKKRVLDMMLGTDKRKNTHAFQKDVQTLQNQSISAILDILKKVAEDFNRKNVRETLPGEMIETIVKSSKLAASACPEFLSAVLENGSPDLILMCVEYMQDIPEPFIVKCLEFFLSVEESKISRIVQNGSNIHASVIKLCPLGQRQSQCVNRVMGCPFNSVFLLSSMKKVQFDLILVFLKYLVFLISDEGRWSGGELSDETLIDWISVTLDAHFTQLILTPEAKDILVNLQNYVHQHAEFYAEVTEVNRFLQAMTKTTRTVSKELKAKEEGHYSVEFMEL